MNAVGIVVEYNPFHNGHLFHLEQAKKSSGCDVVIAVMSGPFLQRGEPALVSKWARTKMALLAGVDIVIELPYAFAVQKADVFAYGAVSILNAIGCQKICFGSELGEIDPFLNSVQFMKKNEEEYNQLLKQYLKKGLSYPLAASKAFLNLKGENESIDLSKPNNILGFHYVKAVIEHKMPIEPMTIKRSQADYHDEEFRSQSIASATSIRKALFSDGNMETIKAYVPNTTYALLKQYEKQFKRFHSWELYWPYLKYRIFQAGADELKQIYDVEEGLENRIIPAALHSRSFQSFIEKVKTKRYTWTKLQRMAVHILTNTNTGQMEKRMKEPEYLRLLGMTENGRKYLNKWKKNSPLPLISKLSTYKGNEIDLDIRASRIYALGLENKEQEELLKMEYAQPPIYVEKTAQR